MIHRMMLGRVPAKPHTALYDADGKLMMEHCLTREGFEGPFSILYYQVPPTDETAVENYELPGFAPYELAKDQKLHRRHVLSQNLKPRGDFLSGRQTLLVSADLDLGVVKPNEAAKLFFSNADGDELYFVKEGSGHLECLYGISVDQFRQQGGGWYTVQ